MIKSLQEWSGLIALVIVIGLCIVISTYYLRNRNMVHKKNDEMVRPKRSKSKRRYGFWQTIKHKCKKIKRVIWLVIAISVMILTAIANWIYPYEILAFLFYLFEIVLIGYLLFLLVKKLDRIHLGSDMRLFGLRILSLIVGFTGLTLVYFVFIGPVFAFFDDNIASVLYFGANFGLPLTGKIFFIVFGLGLSIIGCYLFFKFKRKTGRFIWVGRA